MKNRVFPKIEQLKTLKEPIKNELLNLTIYLDNNLDSNWDIFVNPYIGGLASSDIIILHPKKGCTIISIIDWKDLYNYSAITIKNQTSNGFSIGKSFTYQKKVGEYIEIPNPISINKRARDILLGDYLEPILKDFIVPPTVNSKGEEKKASDFRLSLEKNKFFRLCLYFSNHNTDLIKSRDEEGVYAWKIRPKSILFGKDYINSNKKIDSLIDEFDIQNRINLKLWDKNWTNEIKKKLVPAYHKVEHGTYIKLTKEQEKHVIPTKNSHQRLRGGPGSGKTFVIAQRAARIASEGRKVLIVTFNITLHHYIQKQVDRAAVGFDPRLIDFRHFHQVCWDFRDFNEVTYRNKSIKYDVDEDGTTYAINKSFLDDQINNENYYSTIVPKSIINLIDSNKALPHNKWDAIIIDEGQDFQLLWYQMLTKFLTSDNEILLAVDKDQNIYSRNLSWVEKEMKGTKFRGVWRELSQTHRIPEEMLPIIAKFSKKFLNSNEKKLKIGTQQQFTYMKPSCNWIETNKIEYTKAKLEKKMCVDCFNKQQIANSKCETCIKIFSKTLDDTYEQFIKILNEGSQIDDVIILLPSKPEVILAKNYFLEKEYNVITTSNRKSKLNFFLYNNYRKNTLRISTIHSFKGWEMPNVIIVTPTNSGIDKNTHSLIYTALTRSLNSIYIINRSDIYVNYGVWLKSYLDSKFN